MIPKQDLEKPAHTFVSNRLEYCKGLFRSLTESAIRQLQLIQNAAAGIVNKTRKAQHNSNSQITAVVIGFSQNRLENIVTCL